MKNIVIIEDEVIAATHLQSILKEVMPDHQVLATLQSVEESVEYFNHPAQQPDLLFMDINLADGLSFRIFDQVNITCPVIFTTAYDQYAIDAFRVNSIDYLLKPINANDLRRALNKLDALASHSQGQLQQLIKTLQSNSPAQYRSSFLIPVRDKLIPLQVRDIACIFLEDKISHAILFSGKSQSMDKPLDAIFDQLNPQFFFRANRQYIIARQAIKEISVWPISKLALTLTVPTPDRIIISKARVPEFKQWYTN